MSEVEADCSACGQHFVAPLQGTHRLLCGDATNADDVSTLTQSDEVVLVFTSPPYADAREYGGGELTPELLAQFVAVWEASLIVVNLGIIRRDNAVVPYWNAYIDAADGVGLKLLSWNVWDRGQPWSLAQNTAMFPLEHEWVFVFGERRVPLALTVKNKTPGERTGITNRQADGTLLASRPKTVREFRPLGTVFRSPPHIGPDIGHPAMFPVVLPTAYIEAVSEEGDSVADPFMGSGTTLIAAHLSNRRCLGMEIDPSYCDVTVRRWEELTGQKAVRVEASS